MSVSAVYGLRIILRNGPKAPAEELVAQSDRLLVGSGAHCEVRLPVEHAALEHLELSIVDGRVHARACAVDPPPIVGGRPFFHGFVEPGATIGIGPVELIVSIVGTSSAEAATANRERGRRPLFLLAGLVVSAVLAATIQKKENTFPAGSSVEPPALWRAPIVSCPMSAAPQALALGRERRVAAEGKRERRPFRVQDGVAAVPLFETAAACLALGGDPAGAAISAAAAVELRANVQADYHAHQIRLEHAILVCDLRTARYEVKALRAFTERESGPYVEWLSDTARRVDLELAKSGAS